MTSVKLRGAWGRFTTNATISWPELFPFKGLSFRQCVRGLEILGKEWISNRARRAGKRLFLERERVLCIQ